GYIGTGLITGNTFSSDFWEYSPTNVSVTTLDAPPVVSVTWAVPNNITITRASTGRASFSLFDGLGKLVLAQQITDQQQTIQVEISAGVYTYNFSDVADPTKTATGVLSVRGQR
ncbi:MAG TPA: T9SS type A sorting domain-containing protein, partial [Flavobacteriales bacterium]|nr:T9SS type A sorting domain-containing protein [Flavobacteriales bacterium]